MKRYLFRKDQRLRSNNQFRAVLARKCIASDRLTTLAIVENSESGPRLGVSVGKSYGNAVRRNRIKRLSREIFRLNQHNIPPEYDYLLIFSPKMSKKSKTKGPIESRKPNFDELQTSFLDLVELAINRARLKPKMPSTAN
ncbi:MAG TPA: ribonuclease P protein component [Phycisphaerales bacterium]|nr:ribonuclease P protein component [Phycisphaerales bacterium]